MFVDWLKNLWARILCMYMKFTRHTHTHTHTHIYIRKYSEDFFINDNILTFRGFLVGH